MQGINSQCDSWGAAVSLMQMHTGRAPCAFLSKAELLARYNRGDNPVLQELRTLGIQPHYTEALSKVRYFDLTL